ncbi:PIN domain-containing protein [Aliivibrio fischeri]|uniref:PIN domain-containing protein n=1 Tax=Aliivibrio fischeri TaxID=668 RepID=UPI0007C46FBA|nr:PIN domain-containing protein [Aliivibrio fischeri]MBP3142214.1 DUF4935 domain-containing protein [Aliivibrio fischeri]MBP3157156.1 DUF4935 domain-containing protein [Aliivibrio fischeri]MCE7575228.1 PIN domain-containing protein [Aliivibrio fischeri]
MEALESRFVFVDTSIYQSKNFQFHQYSLGRFNELCSERAINLLMSPVVEQEVRSHLLAQGTEAARHVKEFKKTIKILRNLPDLEQYSIFSELSKETINELLTEKFDNFLDDAVSEIVPVEEASLEKIVNSYFNKVAPFSDKKKDEFPDAIILESLINWARKNQSKVYVLSTDGDMEKFCQNSDGWLTYVGDLDEFIERVLLTEDKLTDLSSFALEQYKELAKGIESHLEEQISLIEYSSVGYDVDDEVSEVHPSGLSIESVNVIKVDREYAEFALDLKFDVEAWYTFADYDRSIWDSEDKKYMFVAQSSRHVRNTVKCNAYVTIDFEDGLAANALLGDIEIEDSYIELDPNDGDELEFIEHDLFGN